MKNRNIRLTKIFRPFRKFSPEPSAVITASSPLGFEATSFALGSGDLLPFFSAAPSGSWPLLPRGSRKSPGGSTFLLLRNRGGHCSTGNPQCSRYVLRSLRQTWAWTRSSLLLPHGLVSALIHTVSDETSCRRRCVSPQIRSGQVNVQQVDST